MASFIDHKLAEAARQDLRDGYQNPYLELLAAETSEAVIETVQRLKLDFTFLPYGMSSPHPTPMLDPQPLGRHWSNKINSPAVRAYWKDRWWDFGLRMQDVDERWRPYMEQLEAFEQKKSEDWKTFCRYMHANEAKYKGHHPIHMVQPDDDVGVSYVRVGDPTVDLEELRRGLPTHDIRFEQV